jgi:FKBP-type peptidyl-prolyl cis-trans isomerase 2
MRRAAPAAALLLLLSACGSKPPSEAGAADRIVLHWTALIDGRTYDTTEDGSPTEFALGTGVLPAGVEAAILGMRPGEEKTISVEGAYGPKSAAAIQAFAAADFAGLALKPGMKVLGLRDGKPARGEVVKLEGGKVFLDFSHPLAGKTVGFRLKLVAIKPR